MLFLISPQWWFPHNGNRDLHWATWQQTVGDSYVAFAAGILLMSLFTGSPGSAGTAEDHVAGAHNLEQGPHDYQGVLPVRSVQPVQDAPTSS